MKTNPTGMKVVAYINAEAVDIAARHGDAYHIGKTPDAVMLPLVTLADAEAAVSRHDVMLWFLLDDVAEDYELQGDHDLANYKAVCDLRDSLPKPTREQALECYAAARAAALSKLGEKGNG